MKSILILVTIVTFLVSSVFFLSGCVTCSPCPTQDSIIIIRTGYGYHPVRIKKGLFDDKENWFTEQEYKDLIENWGTDEEEETPTGQKL